MTETLWLCGLCVAVWIVTLALSAIGARADRRTARLLKERYQNGRHHNA